MVKVRDVIAAIEVAGWLYDHTTGDHRVYKRAELAGIVVIAGRPGADMPEGTLTSVCRQAGINKGKLKRGER